MIYGEKFLVTESKVDKINEYKKYLNEGKDYIEKELKALKINADLFEKTYPIYLSINNKNIEDNYKKIEEMAGKTRDKIDELFNNIDTDIFSKIYKIEHSFLSKNLIKEQEILDLKSSIKDKLKYVVKEIDKYYNKYKDYMENVDESKIYQSLSKKSAEIYKSNPKMFDEYDNPDGGTVEALLDIIRDSIGDINSHMKYYN